MTRIDPNRLSEILRALAAAPAESVGRKTGVNDNVETKRKTNVNQRDFNRLKEQLSRRLRVLRKDSPDFESEGPTLAIREILCWEFGEHVLEHPEFNRVTHSITSTMLMNLSVKQHMSRMLDQLVK